MSQSQDDGAPESESDATVSQSPDRLPESESDGSRLKFDGSQSQIPMARRVGIRWCPESESDASRSQIAMVPRVRIRWVPIV